MSDLTTPRARRKRKGRADGQDGPSIDPTSQQDDDDDDDVRDVRDEVRHATTKKYFRVRYVSHQTSLRRLSLARRPKMGRMDGSTMERAFGVLLDRAERPERRRDARVRPTPHRVVSSRRFLAWE